MNGPNEQEKNDRKNEKNEARKEGKKKKDSGKRKEMKKGWKKIRKINLRLFVTLSPSPINSRM